MAEGAADPHRGIRGADDRREHGRPAAARLAGPGIALAVALAAVIAWVLAAHLRPTAWDTALHTSALDHRTAGLTAVAVAVSASSEYLAYVVAAVGVLLALRSRPWWFGALAGVLLLAAEQGTRVALAAVVGRSRPPEGDWGMHAAGFSMPSGHTATATFAAGLLCLGLARGARGTWRFPLMAVLVLWAVCDGVGRVYLGVHWPTDVVAGWLLGALFTVLAAWLLARVPPAGSQRGEPPIAVASGRPWRTYPEDQGHGGETSYGDDPGRSAADPSGRR